MRDLRGKTVLVTGAASGLGRELALCAGREGAVPILVEIDPDGLETTSELLRRMGVESRRYVTDVSDPAQADATAGAVLGEFGGLDVRGISTLCPRPCTGLSHTGDYSPS